MEEAIDWLKRSPFQEGEIEIRPIFDLEDFAAKAGMSQDQVAQEQRLRAQAEQNTAH